VQREVPGDVEADERDVVVRQPHVLAPPPLGDPRRIELEEQLGTEACRRLLSRRLDQHRRQIELVAAAARVAEKRAAARERLQRGDVHLAVWQQQPVDSPTHGRDAPVDAERTAAARDVHDQEEWHTSSWERHRRLVALAREAGMDAGSNAGPHRAGEVGAAASALAVKAALHGQVPPRALLLGIASRPWPDALVANDRRSRRSHHAALLLPM